MPGTRSPIVHFRPAAAGDAAAAVPLIYSSGPAAFDYVFAVPGRASAQDFLQRAFVDGAGEFGWRNHCVGVLDGAVVAVGAGYGGEGGFAFTLAAARQILAHYGPRHAPGVIARGLGVERVIPPPARGMHYLAHLGVAPELRGQGIGRALVEHLLARGRALGRRRMVLDVAASNPRAQALYERLGFTVTEERRSRLANGHGAVPDHRRMERVVAG
ncbi:GNAT family N-acetyltransferase [Fulvimonas soli]|jgi:ribosomal protein S18 acetylase RimI-like enzyme|uniref:Acetyltransferase (GNAT) family protein n=1 Tax=Fulvimonas soli TaxID=155197 RepID=A0A316I987_9GAMM|nr:N-acetyltransferase [Fulvimonas soli]PWK83874.1 acetyltransferase (GNAT) family protein [Fulvimonas soli]TNY25241.1 GNAT family N-acetyltransferase [Fulvimonas soli]